MSATYTNILNAVKSTIQGLSLDGVASSNIVIGKVPTDRVGLLAATPGILIAPFGSSSVVGGTNINDDISYPVLIAMLQTSNTDQAANRDRALTWSGRISSVFRKSRLSGVPTVYQCNLTSDTKFDSSAFFTANVDVNVIQLQFINREARG